MKIQLPPDLPSHIDPRADVIDTRNIVGRIEEIEFDHQDNETGDMSPRTEWDTDANNEWVLLTDLIEEIGEEGCRDGVILVRETAFRNYIKDEFADLYNPFEEYDRETFGNRKVPWSELMSRAPFKHIDWDAVAEDERSGYAPLEYNGVTYYYMEP